MASAATYRENFVWDSHCGFELQPDAPLAPLLAPWLEADVGYLSVNVAYDPQPWFLAIQNLAFLRRRLPDEVPDCRIVESVGDIDRARAEGKMAVTFDIEGANALDGRLDMVVDCSHCGVRTTMEVMERSVAPVVFSHSNPRTLADHERNIADTQIRACAETGGVIGINGVNLFLGEAAAHPAAVARHVAHVAELTSPQHVGLSLDYAPDLAGDESTGDNSALLKMIGSSPYYWPKNAGYEGPISSLDVRRLPEVAEELAAVGFDEDEITGILGANFRRIAEQVWK